MGKITQYQNYKKEGGTQMIGIIEGIYKIVKGYMEKQIKDTGNQEFIDKFEKGFALVEEVWAIIKEQKLAKKGK